MSESRAAYDELLATLRTVGGRFAGPDWGPTDPVDVAEGLRQVTHLLAIGLETQFEDDAAHPVFRAIVTPWRKALGDNADARYHDAGPPGRRVPRGGGWPGRSTCRSRSRPVPLTVLSHRGPRDR